MPRIEPIQLLNCLSVLLSPQGGIKSRDEVQRLVRLMTKFSKKLVSKCIYIQILKCTETELLGLFMGSGGWRLVHMWLTESIVANNWPLVRELLELLLMCPVDIERLKTNNCPKLVKELSKDGNHFAIRALALKLVEQWLKTVKGEHVTPVKIYEIPQIISDAQLELNSEIIIKNVAGSDCENVEKPAVNSDNNLLLTQDTSKAKITVPVEIKPEIENEGAILKEETEKEPEALPVLKISVKDGKQIISQVEEQTENKDCEKSVDNVKNKERSKSKDKSHSRNSSSSSKSSSSKSSSKHNSSSDKQRSHKSSSNSSSSSKSNSHHSSKDKSKEKDKHSSHSSKSSNRKSHEKTGSSSSKSRDERHDSKQSSDKDKSDKDKIRDKEKTTGSNSPKSSIDKIADKQTPSIHKLGKIPKLSDVKKEKPSISIEVRKPDDPKPKTVKTFNSKFRKHGLEEEIKPPPSRASLLNKKTPPALPPPVAIPKRPSPVHNETPPEKKPKIVETIEKPGAIKLIPPKPKPMMLLESDMFMDALNASATTTKKEPKKRKRRTSGSKDAASDGSPPQTPTSLSSPTSENKSVPPRFYKDILDNEEDKEKTSENATENKENVEENNSDEKKEDDDTSESRTSTVNGLKGVLVYHKKKGQKKSIKWKPDDELEEIQYFELDETERVNVTKTFTDMKYLERIHEREAFQKARNLSTDDVMEEKTNWRPLIPIDTEGQIQVEYGKLSKEKDIQAFRQKGTLQPLYFHKSMIPDSAFEPEPETHTYSEPTTIPLEDVTGNQDNISDFRNMPWPEPKGNAPPATNNMNVPSMFPTQFPSGFPGPQFPGVPGFQGPNMMPGDWPAGVPPQLMPNGMPMPMAALNIPPGPMPPGNMPPGLLVPPDNMMMTPDMFGAPNPAFPVPPDGFNMPQNMFPPDFNMVGVPPQGPPGPDVFPGPDGFSGPGNFRGAMRGRGAGGHWRGKPGGNWDGPNRGRGGSRGSRKTVCIYFQRKGSCRQGDNCSFLHPGVNGPY